MRQLVETLRERLDALTLASSHPTTKPWNDQAIEDVRERFRPRHLPDELVDYWKLGPASPLALVEKPAPLTGSDDDAIWLRRRERASSPNTTGPLSARWIPIAANDRASVLVATIPARARHGAVILWDSAPSAPQPMFPSLESFLSFLNETAARILDGTLTDDRGFEEGWFWDLVYPDRAENVDYEAIRQAAANAATQHGGWVPNQPIPSEGGWTPEWITALGIADTDIANQY